MNKEQQYAADVHGAITGLFDPESENFRYNLEEIDPTAFFTGFILAFSLLYKQLSDSDEDLIGATHLANRLAFQYLMDNGKEAGE